MGSHQSMKGFQHLRCTGAQILTARDRRGGDVSGIPYQIDGDFGGTLPLTVSVGPGRLRLRIPGRK